MTIKFPGKGFIAVLTSLVFSVVSTGVIVRNVAGEGIPTTSISSIITATPTPTTAPLPTATPTRTPTPTIAPRPNRAPVIVPTGSVLNAGWVNVPYKTTIKTFDVDFERVRLKVTNLPAWLTSTCLKMGNGVAQCTLQGTPRQVGSYPITVTATDIRGLVVTKTYTMVVGSR